MINSSTLQTAMQEPNWAEVTGEPCLVLDLSDVSGAAGEMNALVHWLQRQSVPVVGLGVDKEIAHAFDLLVDTREEAAHLGTLISKHPHASSVLVQVTRVTTNLPAGAALVVESLGYATLQGGAEFSGWLSAQSDRVSKHTNEALNPIRMARSGEVLTVQLNNPANRNALSVAMRDSLGDAFKLVAMDESIKRVQVSGAGPCFSAGGDLSEFGTTTNIAEAHSIRQQRMPAQYLVDHCMRYEFNLHGACIGAGIELPAFGGRVTATKDTFFRLPEVAMGLIPGAGGCVSIPRRIGRHRTNYLAITGVDLSAEQALAWGLIDELVS